MKPEHVLMNLRLEAKQLENQGKAAVTSPDVVQTADFVFSQALKHQGDSGKLLLAQRKGHPEEQYLVKHAYTDCACNEFIYTKLAQAMGYPMPDARLFWLSPEEKRRCFQTEYIIGTRYLTVVDKGPSYETIRKQAKNWKDFFAFFALYCITGEADGVEILLANDGIIYRVDTTDAFPLSTFQLDFAGINLEINGCNPYAATRVQLLNWDLSGILNAAICDWELEKALETDPESRPYFLEPFARIQEIRRDYIDDFLNTLCYFYPDYIGEFYKRYILALQKQCAGYLKEKR